jgi:hypothetical protein
MARKGNDLMACRFCTDDDFARRHILEDQVLNDIASVVVTWVNAVGETGVRSMSPLTFAALRDAVERFKSTDSDAAEEKRTIKSLLDIQDSLDGADHG